MLEASIGSFTTYVPPSGRAKPAGGAAGRSCGRRPRPQLIRTSKLIRGVRCTMARPLVMGSKLRHKLARPADSITSEAAQ